MTRKGVNGLRYEPTEYLYASARIRALETRLLHTKQRGQLLSAPSVRALLDELDAKDADRTLTDGERGEVILQERLQAAFAVVRDSVPDPTLTRFLQYPYDCHNLKVLEKCRQNPACHAGYLLSRRFRHQNGQRHRPDAAYARYLRLGFYATEAQ